MSELEDVKNQVLLKPHKHTNVNQLVVAYTKGIKTVCPILMEAIKNKEATFGKRNCFFEIKK